MYLFVNIFQYVTASEKLQKEQLQAQISANKYLQVNISDLASKIETAKTSEIDLNANNSKLSEVIQVLWSPFLSTCVTPFASLSSFSLFSSFCTLGSH
jgi:hypothetical protein